MKYMGTYDKLCERCGAPLDWLQTDRGYILVESEPVFVAEGKGTELFYTDAGERIQGREASPDEPKDVLEVAFRKHRCRDRVFTGNGMKQISRK